MTGNPYGAFKTDPEVERKGAWLDYGQFRVLVARAGGANKQFAKALNAKLKPHRRQIQTETMDEAVAERITREVYAETIVLGWEVKEGDEWKSGLHDPETGAVVKTSADAYKSVFEALPDLFADIREQSQKASIFRDLTMETDAGN